MGLQKLIDTLNKQSNKNEQHKEIIETKIAKKLQVKSVKKIKGKCSKRPKPDKDINDEEYLPESTKVKIVEDPHKNSLIESRVNPCLKSVAENPLPAININPIQIVGKEEKEVGLIQLPPLPEISKIIIKSKLNSAHGYIASLIQKNEKNVNIYYY